MNRTFFFRLEIITWKDCSVKMDLRRKQCWNPDIQCCWSQFALTVVLEAEAKAVQERNWKTSKSSRVSSWRESSADNRKREELLGKA